MDNAQESVTNMTGMVPMVQKQFEDNLKQLEITQENALEAHDQSQTAEKVCYLSQSHFVNFCEVAVVYRLQKVSGKSGWKVDYE